MKNSSHMGDFNMKKVEEFFDSVNLTIFVKFKTCFRYGSKPLVYLFFTHKRTFAFIVKAITKSDCHKLISLCILPYNICIYIIIYYSGA